MLKTYHYFILFFFISYATTFLPNFNIFNELKFIGPFPEPMAWVLFINALNTFLIFVLYKVFYKYFCDVCDEEFSKKER